MGQLLVSADATVTCPKCEHEFSLEGVFANKALEGIDPNQVRAESLVRMELEAERRRSSAAN